MSRVLPRTAALVVTLCASLGGLCESASAVAFGQSETRSTRSSTSRRSAARLGDRVVAYCKQQLGKRVGDGECTRLAEAALRSAGAKERGPGNPRGPHPETADYVWGTRAFAVEREEDDFKTSGKVQDIRPGDIIQFKNAIISGRIGEFGHYTLNAQHHTAVVAAVEPSTATLKMYHQNWNGHKTVISTTLHLADLKQGRLSIYHPIPRSRRQQSDVQSDWPAPRTNSRRKEAAKSATRRYFDDASDWPTW